MTIGNVLETANPALGLVQLGAAMLQQLMTAGAPAPCLTDAASMSDEAGQDEGPSTTSPLLQGLQQYGEPVAQAQADAMTNGWSQGKAGNCASVATIKATQQANDGRVFDQVKHDKNGYDVTMQDGYHEQVSNQEYRQAQKASGFQGSNAAAEGQATLAYAAMAKRDEGHGKVHTFGSALNALNSGQNPYTTANLLGVEHSVETTAPDQAGQHGASVAWDPDHAVFVHDDGSQGDVADHYGTAEQYNGTDTRGNTITNALTILPQGGVVA